MTPSPLARPVGWESWTPTLRATLMFIFRDHEVLLIRKKRGLGAGKINGPGGKIDPGESPAECAIRETREELLVEAVQPQHAGLLHFQFTDGLALECHVFRADQFSGSPTETDEAIPLWTPTARIPFHEMWADDIHWFHHLTSRTPFRGFFHFENDHMLSCLVLTP
jgi:8-oxo-dGTP diphosphatase